MLLIMGVTLMENPWCQIRYRRHHAFHLPTVFLSALLLQRFIRTYSLKHCVHLNLTCAATAPKPEQTQSIDQRASPPPPLNATRGCDIMCSIGKIL